MLTRAGRANVDAAAAAAAASAAEEEVGDCAICAYPVSRPLAVLLQGATVTCTHAYHTRCIDEYIQRGGVWCAVCRGPFDAVTRGTTPRLQAHATRASQERREEREAENQRAALAMQLEEWGGELGAAEQVEEEEDDIPCFVCSGTLDPSRFLLCDGPGCSRGAHTYCVGLRRVPKGSWLCDRCKPPPSPNAVRLRRCRQRQKEALGAQKFKELQAQARRERRARARQTQTSN